MSRLHPLAQSAIPPSPPLTPQSTLSSDPANTSFESSDGLLATSPAPMLPVVPPSPYDPLLTPSFRHSPPRLPSDQPWRFPSPSHPLHSKSRELSLSMLIRDLNSPNLKSSPGIDSPSRVIQASPMRSPRIIGFGSAKRSILDLETPESMAKPSPRALFHRTGLPFRIGRSRRIEESPLARNSRMSFRSHKKSVSELTDDWLSEGSSSTLNLGTTELLANNDPFVTIYTPWGGQGSETPHRRSPPIAESPVLRSGTLPTGVGLGIGLLAPFILPDAGPAPAKESDSDFDVMYTSVTDEEGDEAEVATVLVVPSKGDPTGAIHTTPPPSKKRRTAADSQD